MLQCDIRPRPSEALWRDVAAHAPWNPFHTSGYAEARMLQGWEPWMITLQRAGELVSGCPMFVKTGYLSRSVDVPSLPTGSTENAFWERLQEWYLATRASRVDLGSFGSDLVRVPPVLGERARRTRVEYVLDLCDMDSWEPMATNHQRNIKRGRNAGLRLWQGVDLTACQRHVDLIEASMDRRRARGERITESRAVQWTEVSTLTRAGVGILFQALAGPTVVSSILLLVAEQGGYYHSAGTSTAGMRCGASHWLVREITETLRRADKHYFYLGGVSEVGSGLDVFKRGFGGRRVDLEAVEVIMEGGVTRWLGTGARLLRQVAGARGGRCDPS